MIQSYLKKRNLAALVYGVGIVLTIWHNKVLGQNDDWMSNVLLFATAGAFIAACWFYLKAKKRTGAWLLLLPANFIALLVYWALEDHSERPDNIPCPKCGAANIATDTNCRLCHSVLAVPSTSSGSQQIPD